MELKQGDIISNVSVIDVTIYESYSITKFADGYDTSIIRVETYGDFNYNQILKESTYQITLVLATQLLSIQETLE